MSTTARPRVALGLFVYNGERHLPAALDALLDQTMGDFILAISDNASDDSTEEICRSYASRDRRVCYVRQEVNRGPAWNCNFVASQAEGFEYFKWCAHDDIYDPTYLERCVARLDDDRAAVACQPRTRYIDSRGNELMRSFREQHFSDPRPWVRLDQVIRLHHDYTTAFALIRGSVLSQIRPYQSIYAGDAVMLEDLVLRGRLLEHDEHLFANRIHPKRSSAVTKGTDERQRWVQWFGGVSAFPLVRLFDELRRGIDAAPLDGAAKLRCEAVLARWMRTRWRGFGWELARGSARAVATRVPGSR